MTSHATKITNAKKIFNNKTEMLILLISIAFLATSPFLPSPETMGEKGWVTLAIVLFGIVLWFTKIIPPAITSMVVVVLFPLFNVLTFPESASSLGRDIIWLIIAMLAMGVAVEKTGLSKRIVYSLFSLAKGDMRHITLTLIMVAVILTFFIPNAIGRVTVLIPIALGIIKALENQGGPNIAKSCMLIITYTPLICTVSLITGATGSIYAASLFESMLGFEWTYLYWMLVMFPTTLMILLMLWLILMWKFPVEKSKLEGSQTYFKQEKDKLGLISHAEKKLLFLYILLILLWVSQGLHHIPIAMAAVITVILMFLPGINLGEWKSTMKEMDWGVPLLFAAGLTMATAFQESGVVNWVTSIATTYLSDMSAFLLAATLMLSFVMIRIGFTNLSTTVASLMPVALTFAIGTPFNPVWVGMICVIASSWGFLFPSQSIGTMVTYSLGYFTSQDLFKVGLLLTAAAVLVTLLAAFYYWPVVGLSIY